MPTIYYDYEPNYGVNATCVAWTFRNEFFKSWGDFVAYLDFQYGDDVELVEITTGNYEELCEQGIFNECCH